MTESEMFQGLRVRYPEDSYVLLPHVRDGTGATATRTADALAFGLWPSRGLEVEGFEIKCSRNDWLRELKAPEKADAIYGYCDRWWLVVSDFEYVKDGELPPTWGLLVWRNDRMECKVKAPKLTPKEMDRPMFGAILRQLQKQVTPNQLIEGKIAKARKEGIEHGEWTNAQARKDLEKIGESLRAFEETSGVRIHNYNGAKIGAAVRFVMENSHQHWVRKLKEVRDRLAGHLENLDANLKEVEGE